MTNPLIKLALDNKELVNSNLEIIKTVSSMKEKGLPLPLEETIKFLNKDAITLQIKEQLSALYGCEVPHINKKISESNRASKILELLDAVPDNEYDFVTKLLLKWKAIITPGNNIRIDTDYVIPESNNPITFNLPRIVTREALLTLNETDQERVRLIDPKEFDKTILRKKIIKANAVYSAGYSTTQIENAVNDWLDTETHLYSFENPDYNQKIYYALKHGLDEPHAVGSIKQNAKEILTRLGIKQPRRLDSRRAGQWLRDHGYHEDSRKYFLVKFKS